MFRKLLAVAAASTALFSVSAQAANLDFTYYAYGGLYSGPDSFPVGGGGNFIGYFNYTADNSQIVIDFSGPVTWSASGTSLNSGGLYIDNGALFTNPNIVISSVSINAASTVLGSFGAGNITFNANNVALSWANLSFTDDSLLILDINGHGAVPEPASWALMIAGFGIAGAAMRRRQAARVSFA